MVRVPLTTLGAWHLWRVGTVDPPLAFLRPKLPPPVDPDLHLSFASGARWLCGLLASTSATGLGSGRVFGWGVRVGCSGGVFGWGVRVGCLSGAFGWGVRVGRSGGGLGWGVRVGCSGGVCGWGVRVGCSGGAFGGWGVHFYMNRHAQSQAPQDYGCLSHAVGA